MRDADNPRKFIQAQAEFYALLYEPFAAAGRLWLGSEDGTALSNDGGNRWTIFRAEIAVDEKTKTYAYPNPFAPRIDGNVRIRYQLPRAASVTIRIFDFAMNPVRTLIQNEMRRAGEDEDVWNGRTDTGARVANGVYFYSVEVAGEAPLRGKILVLE